MKSGHNFTGDDIKEEIANSIKEIGQSPEYIISGQGHNLVNRIVKSVLPHHIDISHANNRRAMLGVKMLEYFKKQEMLLADTKQNHSISSDIIESDFGIYKDKKSLNKLF